MTRLFSLLVALALWSAQATAADPYAVPARPGSRIDARFFGTHVHQLVKRPNAGVFARPTPWPDVPFGTLRLWDGYLRWADLEPQPGRWDFDRFDRVLALAEQHGATVIYTLGSTPRWASARPDEPCPYGPGCAAEPRDLADWERYVQAVARRYRGRIAWYEVWNEPHPHEQAGRSAPGGFYTGDWATLVEMTRRAHEVLRREDPRARLLSPAFDGSPEYLARFLSLGAGRWIDGVAFHYYGTGDAHVVPLTRDLRALMARHGLAGLPLLNTETGYGAPETSPGAPPPDRTQAAALTARSMILAAFAGLDGWVHYSWDSEHTGMVDGAGRPTPSHTAYRRVRQWLLGAEPLGCRSTTVVVTCTATRGAQRLVLMWRHGGQGPAPATLPDHFTAATAEHLLDGPLPLDRWSAGTGRVQVDAVPVAFFNAPASP